MKQFYNLFTYETRSFGIKETFSQCVLLQDFGPLKKGRTIPYIVFNLETQQGYCALCENYPYDYGPYHKFSLQLNWTYIS